MLLLSDALTIDEPVVEVIANKRGRPTLAEAALKLDKLQQTQKTLPIIAKRSTTKNKKATWKHLKYNFFYFFYNSYVNTFLSLIPKFHINLDFYFF